MICLSLFIMGKQGSMKGTFQNFMLMQGHEMEKLRTLVLVAMFIDLFKFCYVLAYFIFPVCLIQICSLHLK